MNKLIIPLVFIFFSVTISFSQELIDIEAPSKFSIAGNAGVGTSWLTFPKAFLVNPEDVNDVWSVAPSTNGFCAEIGVQGILRLGKHWVFLPEIGFSYLSGEMQINELAVNKAARELQSYVRLNVPLHFGLVSTDNFWFAFGPTVFFTLHDNKGFDKTVSDLTQVARVDSDVPVGISISIIAAIEVNDRMYIDAKFEYDTIKHFRYNTSTETYEVRPAMQHVTIGVGYLLHQAK